MNFTARKWLFIGVAIAVFFLYLPCVRYDFVSYDDGSYVYCNERVINGLSLENALWAAKSCGYASNWHPLTWLSLQADATASKMIHGRVDYAELSHVMHFHNVLLHTANTILLLLLMMAMCRVRASLLPSLLALLWALHPLRVEVVCWVSERKELLCVFWMLISLLTWIGRDQRQRLSAKCCLYIITFTSFVLALLAKPLAVTLPATLFAWDWIVRRRTFRGTLLRSIPFAVCSLITCYLTIKAQDHALYVGGQFTFMRKIALSLAAPIVYARQTLWPFNLSTFYPTHASLPFIEAALGLVLLAGMGFVVLRWLLKGERWAAKATFAVIWVYVSLLPMLGIVKVGDQPHSDRYTYWIGCAAVVLACAALKRLPKVHEPLLFKAFGVMAVCISIATGFHMLIWKDSYSLLSDAVPKSWAAQPVVAFSRLLRNGGEEGMSRAEWILREASTHVPFAEIDAELANIVAFRKERSPIKINDGLDPAFVEARMLAESALAAIPNSCVANEALGIVAMKEERWADAIGYLEKAQKDKDIAGRVAKELEVCRQYLAKKDIK